MATDLHLLSVDEVARTLGVHVRTVRRYLRAGRLKGVKIGKQYRIAAPDLDALLGYRGKDGPGERPPGGSAARTYHSEASAVVQIDAIGPEAAARITKALGGAIRGYDKHSHTPLRVDTAYDDARARLKLILTGSLPVVLALLQRVVPPEELPH